jgi:hypothetical protein
VKALIHVVAAAGAATLLCSCQVETDVTTGPVRHVYPFQGAVDSKFVGEWHTNPAPAGLSLKKDGSLGIVAVVVSPHGNTSSKLNGLWLVSGSDLLLKYRESGDGQDVVLKYSATLSGNTLKLVQAGNGVKSTYIRKPN